MSHFPETSKCVGFIPLRRIQCSNVPNGKNHDVGLSGKVYFQTNQERVSNVKEVRAQVYPSLSALL